MVLATQNPVETEGTYPLPEAQLDRFLFKIEIGYPSHRDEVGDRRARRRSGQARRRSCRSPTVQPSASRRASCSRCRTSPRRSRVDEQVIDYAVRIGRATRGGLGLAAGSGLARRDRAGARRARRRAARRPRLRHARRRQALRAAGACATASLLAPDAQLEGRRVDELIVDLLATVEAPRL